MTTSMTGSFLALEQLAFEKLGDLLVELGLDISHHKTVTPATKVICLGILVDTNAFTLSIPEEKLKEIKHLIAQWQHKKSCSKSKLQSLLGSLLYISKCVKHSRFFLNRLLHTLTTHSNAKFIPLNSDFKKDIAWFKNLVQKFNGVMFFEKPIIDYEICLDASLKGLVGVCGQEVYHARMPQERT